MTLKYSHGKDRALTKTVNSLVEFWKRSYTSDTRAFWFELGGVVFTVVTSMYLAVNAANPNMLYVYPGAFAGALLQCYASMRRRAAWVAVLTGYFCVINVFGFGRAIGWW